MRMISGYRARSLERRTSPRRDSSRPFRGAGVAVRRAPWPQAAVGTVLEAKLAMPRVVEIMSGQVFSLSAACPVRDAFWALVDRSISGAPVLDDAERLVGVVSKVDLVNGALDGIDNVFVGDVMTPAVIAVAPEDDALDAVRLMLTHHIRRLVVLDNAGNLAGLVTATDCLTMMTEGEPWRAKPAANSKLPATKSPSSAFQ